MSKPLLIKALVTTVLAGALCIPLGAIRAIVAERAARRDGVIADIQRTAVSPQKIAGPILVIPFRKTHVETSTSSDGVKSIAVREELGQLHFVPEELSVDATVNTEYRYRGIYAALLYQAHLTLRGAFALPDKLGVVEGGTDRVAYEWDAAYVTLGLSDTRGIQGKLAVSWDDGTKPSVASFQGGSRTTIDSGVHAVVGRLPAAEHIYRFAIDLQLQGAGSLEVVPAGKETTVRVRSPWPHPSFVGQFLPASHTITSAGFDAVWRTSRLATNIEGALEACGSHCSEFLSRSVGVSFIQPVDVYLQTERSAKYGFLFVVFTFVLFALYELLKRLAIHPIQYALVGVALAMFFLLLVALSEHLPFAASYAIASTSCVLLLAFYVSYVLRAARRGAAFAGLLGLLYGALYVLLQSEDLALVLGALLLFGILGAVMFVTRRVDWYRLTAREAPPAGAVGP
jgi:inner membrane protein